jgi:O-succinylbenzoate synthase
MRIDRVTLTHVRIPLVEAFRISNGVVAEKDAILVMVDADGLTGVGEASPMAGAFYSPETPEGTWDDLAQRIIPAVVSMRPKSLDDVCGVLEAIGGNPFARAGVETAFWDIEAQRRGQPLARLLGGSRTRVDSGLAVGIASTIPELIAMIEHRLADGYKRLKIKVQPGWDLDPLREVRRQFGDIPLMVDANCAYSREHFEHLRRFDEFGMIMIEQPLAKGDLEGHALLQDMIETPVCLDEGAEDPTAVQLAIDIGACRIINIKIQRVGGLRNAVRIHDMCAAAGIPVWAGTMPELGIGGAQTVHLATLPNFRYPTDVQASRRWFVDDVIVPLLEVHDGEIQIPMATGNAYQVAAKVVAKYTVRKEVLV